MFGNEAYNRDKLRIILTQWVNKAGGIRVGRVTYRYIDGKLTIFAPNPRLLVGRDEMLLNEYKGRLHREISGLISVNVLQVEEL